MATFLLLDQTSDSGSNSFTIYGPVSCVGWTAFQALRTRPSVQAAVQGRTARPVHRRALSVRQTLTQRKVPVDACRVTSPLTIQVIIIIVFVYSIDDMTRNLQ